MHKREKILFIVGTEYHTLVTLSAISDLYSDPSKFEITIYQTNSDNRNRTRDNIQLNLPHVQYKSFTVNSRHQNLRDELIAELKIIEGFGYDILVIFNEHVEINVYLAKSLSARGAHIILAPDGMKSYDKLTQIAPRWSLKFSLRYRNFVKKHNLNKRFNFVWPRMRYAFLKEVNEVWITSPMHFENWNNKTVTKFDVMQTPKAIELINRFFSFNPEKEMAITEKVIFLICMPPKYQALEDFNEELIQTLLVKFPEYKFMLKLHPATNAYQIERLQRFDRCILIQSHIPAELFIAQLKNSIVISYWSTSSLIDNPQCRFYWLVRIVLNSKSVSGILNIPNPTTHITEVKSIDEIK